MKVSVFECFTIISCCFLIIACNSNSGFATNKPLSMNDTVVVVGCRDKINLEAGSIVEIQLQAVPSTGYQWIVKDATILLEQHKTDVLKYAKYNQHSFQILHFKAMKKGTEILHLEYKRVFEKGGEKSCAIKIEII